MSTPAPKIVKPANPSPPMGFPNAPAIRLITLGDIFAAFRYGFSDFLSAPLFGLFFAGVYVAGGFLAYAIVSIWDSPVAIIPLAIAFPLLGPFIAVGLYEVSRRISTGEPLSWGAVLGVIFAQRKRELNWMAFVMLFIFWIWAYQIRLLIALFIGSAPLSSLDAFTTALFTTENGLTFLIVGCTIGSFLSILLFSVTIISVPLLLDRDVDIVTAMVTSVTTVRRNMFPMLFWCAFVVMLMFLALLPAFLGLFIVLPVLGHTTWRIYECAIVRES